MENKRRPATIQSMSEINTCNYCKRYHSKGSHEMTKEDKENAKKTEGNKVIIQALKWTAKNRAPVVLDTS